MSCLACYSIRAFSTSVHVYNRPDLNTKGVCLPCSWESVTVSKGGCSGSSTKISAGWLEFSYVTVAKSLRETVVTLPVYCQQDMACVDMCSVQQL